MTGVQRYLDSILQHTRGFAPWTTAAPRFSARGWRGHLWEQVALPVIAGRSLLWSPVNSGPLCYPRQVVTIHDMAPLDHPEWCGHAFGFWYRRMLPRLAQQCVRIVTVSHFSRQRILAHTHVDPERISVIPNGVDARFTPERHDQNAAMRKALNLPQGRYVLSVGSLAPRKNIARLLEAWREQESHLPKDMHLILAGDNANHITGGNMDLSFPPRTRQLGHVPDQWLPALYANAHVFAYISCYEGFGLPILEAMASGVPVLTSNLGALAELAGEAGWQVDPYDLSAIGDGLRRLVEDETLRSRLIPSGLSLASQFTWQRCADATRAALISTALAT